LSSGISKLLFQIDDIKFGSLDQWDRCGGSGWICYCR